MKWFDHVDIETPYKAIGTITKEKDGKEAHHMEAQRFATQEAALTFFRECNGRCILSHHDFHRKKTKIIAYKFA